MKDKIIDLMIKRDTHTLHRLLSTETKIDLKHSNIVNSQLAILAQSLEKNTTLTTIDLSNNEISDAGIWHLLETLKNNKTITNIDIHNNPRIKEHSTIINIDKALRDNVITTYNSLLKKQELNSEKLKEEIDVLQLNLSFIKEQGKKEIESFENQIKLIEGREASEIEKFEKTLNLQCTKALDTKANFENKIKKLEKQFANDKKELVDENNLLTIKINRLELQSIDNNEAFESRLALELAIFEKANLKLTEENAALISKFELSQQKSKEMIDSLENMFKLAKEQFEIDKQVLIDANTELVDKLRTKITELSDAKVQLLEYQAKIDKLKIDNEENIKLKTENELLKKELNEEKIAFNTMLALLEQKAAEEKLALIEENSELGVKLSLSALQAQEITKAFEDKLDSTKHKNSWIIDQLEQDLELVKEAANEEKSVLIQEIDDLSSKLELAKEEANEEKSLLIEEIDDLVSKLQLAKEDANSESEKQTLEVQKFFAIRVGPIIFEIKSIPIDTSTEPNEHRELIGYNHNEWCAIL